MTQKNNIVNHIEAHVENVLKNWGIPGGAVAIVKDGEVISSRGYGLKTLGKDILVDCDTRFAIGSCTKAFMAACIGFLVDENRLDWNDKVIQHLPDFELYNPWLTDEVTIRDILCHRTGLMRTIRLMWKDEFFDDNDYYKRIKHMKPTSGFRTSFGYNNAHYIIAGKIIEAVAGVSWADFIQKRIFTPLGMSSTTATYTAMINSGADNIASPHANLDKSFLPGAVRMLDPVRPLEWTDYGKNAAGSIISTIKDMSAWIKMLLDKGMFKGKQILSPRVVEELTSPQILIKPEDSDMGILNDAGVKSNFLSYGLGFYVTDYKGDVMIFHDGQVHGFSSAVAFIPDKNVAGIILLNVYHTMVHPMLGFDVFDILEGRKSSYCNNAMSIIKQWRTGEEASTQKLLLKRKQGTSPSLPIERYTGVFKSNSFGSITISMVKNSTDLLFQYGNSKLNIADLEHFQDDTFTVNYRYRIFDAETLNFIVDKKKIVTAFAINNVDIFIKK